MVQISSEKDATANHKTVGYSSGTNEYYALKELGFYNLTLVDYDKFSVWHYKAGNAALCMLYVTKNNVIALTMARRLRAETAPAVGESQILF
jgi:hypothetical protein